MEARRISQRAVKNMINGNTALLHIGNFDTGKRTNLKRAVSECVYTSRLYYNKGLQSDNEKIEYLVYSQPYRVFKVELYETHIAAFDEYTGYHINFDDTSKYYTLVKEIKQSGVITKDQIQTLEKRSNDLRRNVINYNWMDRVGNGYGIPLTEEQGAKGLDWIKSFVGKNMYRYKDIEIIKNASPSDFVFKGFYNNGIGNWCNYLPIYEINGIEYVPMSQPYISRVTRGTWEIIINN